MEGLELDGQNKYDKGKISGFYPLRSLYVQKIVAFLV